MSDERDEWLEWRRHGVGASDVAAILGLSDWASPYTVWLDKQGLSDDHDNEAMEAGRMLEPAIGPWFTMRTGLHVAGEQTWCRHPQEGWARATVDGFVFESHAASHCDGDDRQDFDGSMLGTLEIKTTSEPVSKWEADGIPVAYACQGQWQMYVTHQPRTWFAVLHANHGLKLRVYELERDDDDIAALVERARTFWFDHVLTGVPPSVDGHPATTAALKQTPGDPDAEWVDLDADPDVVYALTDLALVKARIANLEADRAKHENTIRAALGEAVAGTSRFAKSITWKPQERTSFNVKRFRADWPDIANEYTNTETIRVLRIVPHKEQ